MDGDNQSGKQQADRCLAVRYSIEVSGGAAAGPSHSPAPRLCCGFLHGAVPSVMCVLLRGRMRLAGGWCTGTHRGENDPVGLLPRPTHVRIGDVARSFWVVAASHLDSRGKVAGNLIGHSPELAGTIRVVHLGPGHERIRSEGKSSTFPSASTKMQSLRSLAVIRTMVGLCAGNDVRCRWTMRRRRIGPRLNSLPRRRRGGMGATTCRGSILTCWAKPSRYPTQGGGQRALKEEIDWLGARTPPPSGRFHGLDERINGCRRGRANQHVGWTCHDENWSASACVMLTVLAKLGENSTLES